MAKYALRAVNAATLSAGWTRGNGVVIPRPQAIVRAMLKQKRRDECAGLRTAGYDTGHSGSPLGHVDDSKWAAQARLEAADLLFRPGVNGVLAATAVRGAQQLDALPDPRVEGVFAMSYCKGSGIDRSGDAFEHGNFARTHRKIGLNLAPAIFDGGMFSSCQPPVQGSTHRMPRPTRALEEQPA